MVLLVFPTLNLGCQGISPAVRVAHEESMKSMERFKSGYDSVTDAYVMDIEKLLTSMAFGAARNQFATLSEEGMTPEEIDQGLDRLRGVLDKIRERVGTLRQKTLTNNANYRDWLEMSRGVSEVLAALERRKVAEDNLRDRGKILADEAAKRAKRGGF